MSFEKTSIDQHGQVSTGSQEVVELASTIADKVSELRKMGDTYYRAVELVTGIGDVTGRDPLELFRDGVMEKILRANLEAPEEAKTQRIFRINPRTGEPEESMVTSEAAAAMHAEDALIECSPSMYWGTPEDNATSTMDMAVRKLTRQAFEIGREVDAAEGGYDYTPMSDLEYVQATNKPAYDAFRREEDVINHYRMQANLGD